MSKDIHHSGWGKRGRIVADERALRGAAKGAAARSQLNRKKKVPLTLAPHPWASAFPTPIDELPPPESMKPRRLPGPRLRGS